MHSLNSARSSPSFVYSNFIGVSFIAVVVVWASRALVRFVLWPPARATLHETISFFFLVSLFCHTSTRPQTRIAVHPMEDEQTLDCVLAEWKLFTLKSTTFGQLYTSMNTAMKVDKCIGSKKRLCMGCLCTATLCLGSGTNVCWQSIVLLYSHTVWRFTCQTSIAHVCERYCCVCYAYGIPSGVWVECDRHTGYWKGCAVHYESYR